MWPSILIARSSFVFIPGKSEEAVETWPGSLGWYDLDYYCVCSLTQAYAVFKYLILSSDQVLSALPRTATQVEFLQNLTTNFEVIDSL